MMRSRVFSDKVTVKRKVTVKPEVTVKREVTIKSEATVKLDSLMTILQTSAAVIFLLIFGDEQIAACTSKF